MPKSYSKDEVKHFFEDIQQDLVEIKAQTIKTNGRVTRLEKVVIILLTAIAVLAISNPTVAGQIIKLIPTVL